MVLQNKFKKLSMVAIDKMFNFLYNSKFDERV